MTRRPATGQELRKWWMGLSHRAPYHSCGSPVGGGGAQGLKLICPKCNLAWTWDMVGRASDDWVADRFVLYEPAEHHGEILVWVSDGAQEYSALVREPDCFVSEKGTFADGRKWRRARDL